MKLINFTCSIIPLSLLMSACSSIQLTSEPSKHHGTTHEVKQIKDETTELCIYKKEKGIAEVTEILPHSYQFKFYLGDDIFEIDKTELISHPPLTIGDEFKAVKEVMVNNTNRHDCPPVEYHLIP